MKMLLAAAALAALSTGAVANAKTYSLGTVTDDNTYTSNTVNDKNSTKTSKTYIDDFTFNTTESLTEFTSASFTEKNPFSITSADLTLFSGSVGSGKELETTGNFDPQTAATPTISDALKSGSYYIQAATVVPAGKTGSYTVTATTISAAPEPASWLLMIGGIGLIGGMLRMSRRNGFAFTAA